MGLKSTTTVSSFLVRTRKVTRSWKELALELFSVPVWLRRGKCTQDDRDMASEGLTAVDKE